MLIKKLILSLFLLLFVSNLSYSQLVSTTAELVSAVNAASPGSTIILADGTYHNVFVELEKNGTATQPITITAQNPGQALMTGNSRVYLEGAYLTVSGLVFQDPSNLIANTSEIEPVIELKRCDYCKVLNNMIESYNGTEAQKNIKFKWLLLDGQYNEIAYNSFIGKYGIGSIINDNRNTTEPDYLQIHHNYFADRTPANDLNEDNDQDVIRIGNSSTSLNDSYTEVYNNYFESIFGEIEVISNKSGKNKYYNNTFRNYSGTLTLRHGNDCEVYGNYFFADDNFSSGGVRVIGEGHKIYNNYIEGINSFKPSGSSSNATGGINVTNGRLNSELSGYYQVKNCEIVNNTFVDCDYALRVGTNVAGDLNEEPENLVVANNIMLNTSIDAYQVITEPSGTSLNEGNMINLAANALVDDGFFHRIMGGSSPVDASVGTYSYVSQDVLGGNRDGSADAGAEELGGNGANLPLNDSDVGVTVGFGIDDSTPASSCQTTLVADGIGDTYDLISSVLAPNYNPIEAPDCSHPDFGEHIEEVWDEELEAYVFAFHIHVDEDDDRCINFDRQRNEIKTYDQSPDNLKAVQGETVVYKWKFKIDENIQVSSNFTHIHQIKAVGGPEAATPKFTLTLRAGSPNRLELRYAENATSTTIETADMSLLAGVWVEATETITYGESGTYTLSIVRVSDGNSVFSYSDNDIRTWNTDAEFMRPKWGIYRSLDNAQDLRDETVYFADFCIDESSRLTAAPTTVTFDEAGGTQSFDINTNLDWEITETLSWLSLDMDSGSGSATITATALENVDSNDRTGFITISEVAGGSNLSIQVSVIQTYPLSGSGEVIITEFYNRPLKPTQAQLDAALPNNPPGADLSPDEGHTEWFEVYNTTADPIVMDGWTLTDASSSSKMSTIGSFTLEPFAYAVFSGFNIPAAHGGIEFDYFFDYEEPSFNNESSYSDPGDTSCPDGVIIAKADGTIVDEVRYDYGYGEYIGNANAGVSCRDNEDVFGFPPQQGSSRVSFMLNADPSVMNASSNDLAENWSFSTITYDPVGGQVGTPGLANDQMFIFDTDNDGFASDIDCDDTNPDVNPDAEEIPYNNMDDDCDPLTLDDDIDQDGFVLADDCDDADASVNPDATEEAYNGIDDDCDPLTLDDDLDQDGFALAEDCDDTADLINPDADEVPYNGIDEDCNPLTLDDDLDQDGFVLADDCDDNNVIINPDATEIFYNGVDDDCNPMTPDDDLDQDGFVTAEDCNDFNENINPDVDEVPYNGIDDDCNVLTLDDDLDQDGFVLALDCDDTDININPDAIDILNNGIDENCDGEDATDIFDNDNDGYFSDTDCNDNNPNVNPGQAEILYNGIDDDCNLATLDDDIDQDGYDLIDDCDDTNVNVNPGATEVPYNGIDDDCDSMTLDDDLDQDGYALAEDCDDTQVNVNPGATEEPYNGVDDDCDPLTLDDDLDQDGYGIGLDCDDTQVNVNPDADELPYNGIDDDCDPLTLDDDLDQDGYVLANDCDDTQVNVNPDATEELYNGIDDDCDPLTLDDDLDQDGYVLAEDCDDTNVNVNPDAIEEPYNGIDEDCNPLTLDDDLDQDGFVLADDCDDDNPEINPDAEEIVNNGIDEDCDGMDLTSSTHDLSDATLNIFPNPFMDLINIEVEGDLSFETQLFDLDGRLLRIDKNRDVIPVEMLSNGVYFLQVIDLSTGRKVIVKLIKQ